MNPIFISHTISSHLRLHFSSTPLPSGFTPKFGMNISHLSFGLHAPPVSSSVFNHPDHV